MTLNERAERAVELKNSGMYNCAQSVTVALADQTDLTEEQLRQISAGFCAGMVSAGLQSANRYILHRNALKVTFKSVSKVCT